MAAEERKALESSVTIIGSNGKRRRLASHTSWDKLIDDCKRQGKSRTLFYLASLHSDVTMALLLGDLLCKMPISKFRKEVERHVALQDRQGTYSIYLAVRDPNQCSQTGAATHETDIGKGLRLDRIIEVVDKMKLYMRMDG